MDGLAFHVASFLSRTPGVTVNTNFLVYEHGSPVQCVFPECYKLLPQHHRSPMHDVHDEDLHHGHGRDPGL